MRKSVAKTVVIALLAILAVFDPLFATDTNPKVKKSYISEDASHDGFAFKYDDLLKAKNEKQSFTFRDKKITWSGLIRDGLGKLDSSNYDVYWYAPDGALFVKQKPRPIFIDCATLKSSLTIDDATIKTRTGLWKIEVTYEGATIDTKYFYLSESPVAEIAQSDIDALEARITETKRSALVAVVAPVPESAAGRKDRRPATNITPADLQRTYEVASGKADAEHDEPGQRRRQEKLSERLIMLQKEVIAETQKVESLVYKSGKFYDDPETQEYLNGIESRIAASMSPDEPLDVRIKIIRDPTVNAFSLANGSIYITTGTLARLENEAQLAFILSHETSHFFNSDMVYHVDSNQNKTVAYKLFDIVLAPTSVFFGFLGDLTQLGAGLLYASSVTGYGRILEARADRDSIPAVVALGYNATESMGAIEVLLKENEKYQKGIEVFFLMNHPTNQWRIEALKELIAKRYGNTGGGSSSSDEFLMTMKRIKLYNATWNIKLDRLEHARDNIQWILEKFPKNPESHYLAGEIYRLEAEDKTRMRDELSPKRWAELNKDRKKGELEDAWRTRAAEEYRIAIECDPQYANSYKGFALLCRAKGDTPQALENLKKYLELEPNAGDKRFVTNLIERLEKTPMKSPA